jgi:hypothetical protein
MFQKVQLAAQDRFAELAALEGGDGKPAMSAAAWEDALGAYWDDYDEIDASPAARAGELFMVEPAGRAWTVRQIIHDPEGNHDWAIVAIVDLDASDAAGEPVIRTRSFAAAG